MASPPPVVLSVAQVRAAAAAGGACASPAPGGPRALRRGRARAHNRAKPPPTPAAPTRVPPPQVWVLLIGCAAVGSVAEARTRWGAAMSAPLVCMILGATFAAGGAVPTLAVDAAYAPVWGLLMPLGSALLVIETRDMTRRAACARRGAGAAHAGAGCVGSRLLRAASCTLLFAANQRHTTPPCPPRLGSYGSRLLAAFLIGAAGMFAGALVAAALLKPPPVVAACLLASWTGSMVNFMGVAQALQLPAAALPVTMAADNLTFIAVLTAIMACPLRLVRRFTGAEPAPRPRRGGGGAAKAAAAAAAVAVAAYAAGGKPDGGGGGGGGGKKAPPPGSGPGLAPGGGGGGGARLYIDEVQTALQHQVTVPARMSGQLVARDGGLLLTQEPAASTVWAAYQRSRERAAYDPPGGGANSSSSSSSSDGGGSAPAAAGSGAHARDTGAPPAAGRSLSSPPPPPAPIVPPELEHGGGADDGSGGGGGGSGGSGSFERGPLARDGGPLLTAEPSPASLQAAWARSRDASRDGSDDSGGSDGSDAEGDARGGELTARSAAASLAGAAAVCWAAKALVGACGVPQVYLLAVSALALAASAAGGARSRALFSGASRLGAGLMGIFFASIGATSVSGASLAAIAPITAFLLLMYAVHAAVLLAGARALRLEPSAVLVRARGRARAAAGAAARRLARPAWPAATRPAATWTDSCPRSTPHPTPTRPDCEQHARRRPRDGGGDGDEPRVGAPGAARHDRRLRVLWTGARRRWGQGRGRGVDCFWCVCLWSRVRRRGLHAVFTHLTRAPSPSPPRGRAGHGGGPDPCRGAVPHVLT